MIKFGEFDDCGLTPREREVLVLVVKGLNNPEIAKELCISKSTAKSHVSSIIRKFKVTNRVAAVSYAIKHGFLDYRRQDSKLP